MFFIVGIGYANQHNLIRIIAYDVKIVNTHSCPIKKPDLLPSLAFSKITCSHNLELFTPPSIGFGDPFVLFDFPHNLFSAIPVRTVVI